MELKETVSKISKKVEDVATDIYNTVEDKSGKLIEE